ncbi:MAG: hypothetical protein QOG50_1292 [Actinomycetota bacterium]|nr:hypothetical protein [Actinomycetota bacterium]
MIDFDEALSALVERAPEPPDVVRVARRARQRQWRRRGAALTTALVALIGVVAGAIVIVSPGHRARVSTVTPAIENVRITMLDGSQLEISGPASLGLTTLSPAFNGSLGPVSDPQWGTLGHGFSVGHTAPRGLGGAVVGRHPTHDGHELVVHTTPNGVDAIVQYGDWWLDASWGSSPPAQWTAFASELNAKETADGFLVVEPTDASWKLGWADAPDAQLGGSAYGSGAAFAFFGPGLYPEGCPKPAGAAMRTAQGWPVSLDNGASWCDADARVRVSTWDPKLVDAAVQGLRVAYTDAAHAVANITTLDGSTVEVTAPSSVLDQLFVQKAVYVDGLDTPNLLNETPNLLPVSAERAVLPAAATAPSYATGDGHRLFSYVPPTDCGCQMLAGTYGDWLLEIEVQGMSVVQRTQIASLIRANETSAGFLVLDPIAPMHIGPGPGSDIVLDRVDLSLSPAGCPAPISVEAHTPEGFAVHFFGDGDIWCDTDARVVVSAGYDPARKLMDAIRVRRVESIP